MKTDLKQQLHDAQRDHELILGERKDCFQQLGEALIHSQAQLAKIDGLDELKERAQAVEEQVLALDEKQDRILLLKSQISHEKEVQGQLTETMDQKRDSLGPIHERIGRAAFSMGIPVPNHEEQLGILWEQLHQLQGEVAGQEEKVFHLEAELSKKNFFEKIVIRGRLSLARSSLSGKISQMAGVARNFGSSLLASAPNALESNPELRGHKDAAQSILNEISQLEARVAQSEEVLKGHEEHLNEVCEGERAKKVLKKIKEANEELAITMADILIAMGDRLYTASKDSTSSFPRFGAAIQGLIEESGAIEERMRLLEDFIQRLEAAREVINLEKKASEIDRQIARNKELIEKKQLEIAHLKGDLERTISQKKNAEARRGSESELKHPFHFSKEEATELQEEPAD